MKITQWEVSARAPAQGCHGALTLPQPCLSSLGCHYDLCCCRHQARKTCWAGLTAASIRPDLVLGTCDSPRDKPSPSSPRVGECGGHTQRQMQPWLLRKGHTHSHSHRAAWDTRICPDTMKTDSWHTQARTHAQALPAVMDQLQVSPLLATPRLKHLSSSRAHSAGPSALKPSLPVQGSSGLRLSSPYVLWGSPGLEVGVKVWTVPRGQPLD